MHPNCNAEEVSWPDLQQVFRTVVSPTGWTKADESEWPVLDGV